MKQLNNFLLEKLILNRNSILTRVKTEKELADIICKNWIDEYPNPKNIENYLRILNLSTWSRENIKYVDAKYFVDNYNKNFDMIKVMEFINEELSNNEEILSIYVYCSENKEWTGKEWDQIGIFDPDSQDDEYDTWWDPTMTNNVAFKRKIGIE